MRFYFCFGILLCFICITTIPEFSTGMPSSGGSTSNNGSDPISSEVNNDEPKQGDPSGGNNNKDECPIATYYSHKISKLLWDIYCGNENAIREFYYTAVKSPDYIDAIPDRFKHLLQTIFNSDNKKKAIEDYASHVYTWKKNEVDILKQKLHEGDTKKDGTVTIDYAKQILLEYPILTDENYSFDEFYDYLIDRNLNNEHQVVYDNLLADFMTIVNNEDDEDDKNDENDKDLILFKSSLKTL